jgi:hypothetical protein
MDNTLKANNPIYLDTDPVDPVDKILYNMDNSQEDIMNFLNPCWILLASIVLAIIGAIFEYIF